MTHDLNDHFWQRSPAASTSLTEWSDGSGVSGASDEPSSLLLFLCMVFFYVQEMFFLVYNFIFYIFLETFLSISFLCSETLFELNLKYRI